MTPKIGQRVRRSLWDSDAAVKVLAVTDKHFIGEDVRDGTESFYELNVEHYGWELVRYTPQVGDRVYRNDWHGGSGKSVLVTAVGKTKFLGIRQGHEERAYTLQPWADEHQWIKVPFVSGRDRPL